MEARGLLSRISVRGIPTDAHNEIICTKDKIPNSTLYTITRIIIDDLSLEDGKSVERIKQGSSTNYRRARKWVERIGGCRAQGRRPPPDTRTGARAFNAPVAFPPNTPVMGSVTGNRHPSRHSFCSLPRQMTQGVSGHREPGQNV